MSHDFEISRSFENEYLVLRPGIVQNVRRAAVVQNVLMGSAAGGRTLK